VRKPISGIWRRAQTASPGVCFYSLSSIRTRPTLKLIRAARVPRTGRLIRNGRLAYGAPPPAQLAFFSEGALPHCTLSVSSFCGDRGSRFIPFASRPPRRTPHNHRKRPS
jgi:hypothetical protein